MWSFSGQAEVVGDRSRWLQAVGGCGAGGGGAGLAIPGQLSWVWVRRKARGHGSRGRGSQGGGGLMAREEVSGSQASQLWALDYTSPS